MTIRYKTPVRNNVPQGLTYTFKDQNNVVIPLTGYVTAWCEFKLQGQVFATVAAIIVNPTSAGNVQVTTWTPIGIGIWDAQFYCVDGSGSKLYGEPIQFQVVANVDDLTLVQLPNY